MKYKCKHCERREVNQENSPTKKTIRNPVIVWVSKEEQEYRKRDYFFPFCDIHIKFTISDFIEHLTQRDQSTQFLLHCKIRL